MALKLTTRKDYRRITAISLLELLVVIAIIAILASLLFPALVQTKKKAKSTIDISNMRQMYAGIALYEGDHDEKAPRTLLQTFPYVRSADVYGSPLDPRKPDRLLGDWTPAPCGPRGYQPRSKFRISYPYLKTMHPDDTGRYELVRTNPRVGMLANPWLGETIKWHANPYFQGEDLDSAYGPLMSGPIGRIRMDGSYYWLPKRRSEDIFGASSYDMFHYEP